jgi:predicted nicotinamide N-methyase
VAVTNSIFIDDLEIPTSKHPEIRKLKKKYSEHTNHGYKVWNSSIVLIDALKDLNLNYRQDDLIADLGCGWGIVTSYLSKHGANVVGIDIDKKVKPYFEFTTKLNDVYPKFISEDIFSKDFNNDYDLFIACDVCFYARHTKNWLKFIRTIVADGKQLLMSDPGRDPFWDLVKTCEVPHVIERHYVTKPRKTDSYLVIFGE